ncbi:nucleotidyltransferase domain-containing protein [Arhodomonas aquaeolei]|uniref:nucleotidyltransferase domain-containing protein n=1 Tax=Arhodomonas aquaeolei TaxID=2369 RepID=UPI001B7FA5A7|nr:nucleotidyltransferase domain-containing protein [Arhodomonas aquaeolei]
MARHPEITRIGYFGSYARRDWGVGSDLDLVVIGNGLDEPFLRRSLRFDTGTLSVPAEVLVYTELEWLTLATPADRFARTVTAETVWGVAALAANLPTSAKHCPARAEARCPAVTHT